MVRWPTRTNVPVLNVACRQSAGVRAVGSIGGFKGEDNRMNGALLKRGHTVVKEAYPHYLSCSKHDKWDAHLHNSVDLSPPRSGPRCGGPWALRGSDLVALDMRGATGIHRDTWRCTNPIEIYVPKHHSLGNSTGLLDTFTRLKCD